MCISFIFENQCDQYQLSEANFYTDFFSKDLPTSNNPNGGNLEKNCPRTERKQV